MGRKAKRAAAFAAVCALLAGVGLVAAHSSSRAGGTRSWVARPLGNVEAVGINDRGEIAGFNRDGDWPWGRGVFL